MFEEAAEVFNELFCRNSFPYTVLLVVPFLVLVSPSTKPVFASHEFAVYRMQQYDLQGAQRGCRNSVVNMYAKSMYAKAMTRKCIVTTLVELTFERYKNMMEQAAGGLLVLVPDDLSSLSDTEQERLIELESQLLEDETNLPIYFAHSTKELQEILEQLDTASIAENAPTAVQGMVSAVLANGFQMVFSGAQAKEMPEMEILNIQGKVVAPGIEENSPTIAFVAHYDAFGIAPALAKGADSNGSGVAALLEMARLFSLLFTNSRTHAKYNLLFLLSGGGKFSYLGAKHYIESGLDTDELPLLPEMSAAVCLDSIGAGDALYFHVSKPPKEDSVGGSILQNLQAAAAAADPPVNFSVVHKKINLADELLAWEHERFSMRRLPAFTLSDKQSHGDPQRRSILDTRDKVDGKTLARNVKIIAESVAQLIFGISSRDGAAGGEIFTDNLAVSEEHVTARLDYIANISRAAQLMTGTGSKESSLVRTLANELRHYLKDVQINGFPPDKRDPEFMFYSAAVGTMIAYSVKPAVFDLFLAVILAAYFGLMFLFVSNFHQIYNAMRKIVLGVPGKGKVQ